MPNTIQRSMLEQIYKAGLFKLHLPEQAYQSYLASLNRDSTKLWADSNFDPLKEPKVHCGVNICCSCGKVHWVSPEQDAFASGDDKGKICEDCYFEGKKVMVL